MLRRAGLVILTHQPCRSRNIYTDLLHMGTYHFNKIPALDFGAAYAHLKDGVSEYRNSKNMLWMRRKYDN